MPSAVPRNDAIRAQVEGANQPHVPENKKQGFWEIFRDYAYSARRAAGKPLLIMNLDINPISASPEEGPDEALGNIDRLAKEGLRRAKIKNTLYEEITGGLHAHFDETQSRPSESAAARQAAPMVGAVATIPALGTDPEVTRPIPLQTRVAETDWKKRAEENRKNLARKASAFTALIQMRDACGIKERDNLNLLQIVEKATRDGATESLWDLFVNHRDTENKLVYDLSLFQTLKAKWNYWAYYKTSLIDNTVGSYIKSFVAEMEEGLTSEHTLSQLTGHLLRNANEFFIQDIGATRAFANATEPLGDVEKYRRRAIENHYGHSLEALCQTFSKKMINEEYTVPILDRFHDVFLIGLFSRALEWFINRFVIRKAMKSSILPPLLKSAIENGVESTAPHNLPFTVAFTKFLNQQMDNLRDILKNPSSDAPPLQLPGTERLPETIRHLKTVLDLEQLKTQPELRRKFQEIDQGSNGKGVIDNQIEEAIQKGIVTSCHHLFAHLAKMAQSRELSSNLLELSCIPFSSQARDHAALMAEYREEQLKLKKSAGELFKKVIDAEVAKMMRGPNSEDATKAAEAAFNDGKKVAEETFDELKRLSEQITQKINRSGQALTPENNVQADIAVFLQRLQVLANRKELQDRIAGLQEKYRNAIYRQVNPFYQRVEQLAEQMLRLQGLQDEYPANAAVVGHLRFVREVLSSIRTQFHAQPRHLRNPLIQTLRKTCEEIGQSLGQRAPATLRLDGFIQSLSDLSDNIAREQQVIDAIHAFYPPREGQEAGGQGLLEQLLSYEQGVHSPGFQPRACLNEIDRQLECFPESEQRELRELIDDGSDLSAKWTRLGSILQRIYETHIENKNRDAARFDTALASTSRWTDEKIEKFTLVKEKDHADMQAEMRKISAEVARLRADAFGAKVELPFSLTAKQAQVTLAAVGGAVAGGLLGAVGNLAGPTGRVVGAGAGAALYPLIGRFSGLHDKQPGAMLTVARNFALGSLTAFVWPEILTPYLPTEQLISYLPNRLISYLPGWMASSLSAPVVSYLPSRATLIGAAGVAATGYNLEQSVRQNAKDKVLPRVLKTFEDAYELGTRSSSLLTRAFATRFMKTWIEAKSAG
jgi:hypothetical protein